MNRKGAKRTDRAKVGKNTAEPISKRKLWCFRLMALIVLPLICVTVFEVALRVGGFGYPTGFLLKSTNRGEKTFVQNNQFGWRFFGPRASRQPAALSIPREKAPDTVRVFVFGESAAYGDPQPRFGLPRMLEAMLSLRHPGKKFEVVNAAMTGINSHVIRPLAADCRKAGADVWVIYMGNNEVVGPFGAGTVFGSQTLPLPLIRAGLAVRETRSGQLIDSIWRARQNDAAGNRAWEGMRAFIRHTVAASDPRLDAVYENFQQNLEDIIDAGRSRGAKIVLSTVAVNLRDCAPFSSQHGAGFSEAQRNEWQQWFEAGVKAQVAGDHRFAAEQYERAIRIDGDFAELRFRRAQCALALNDVTKAQLEFSAARDLDALRFRCDRRLNEIIRRQAGNGVILVDAENEFARASSGGVPGGELFFEHVHFTFAGNHLLARLMAEKVEQALGISGAGQWPGVAECAKSLGYTARDEQMVLTDVQGRLSDAPFTFQFNNTQQRERLVEAIRALPMPNSAESIRAADVAVKSALERRPNDAVLWELLAEIKQAGNDPAEALRAAQRSLEIVPSNVGVWIASGVLLAQKDELDEAIRSFQQALTLDPQAVPARHNLALCFEKLGRREAAENEFKRALAVRPEYGTGWLALGQLYEKMGRTEDADSCFGKALSNRVNQADDLATLARFCVSRKWMDSAATNFAAAIELRPNDVRLRIEFGRALIQLGRHEDALREFQTAVELAPSETQPRLQLGILLGRLRRPDLAEKEFREAVRLNGELIEARVNLGIALFQQQRFDLALAEFENVLRRNPNETNSLRYIRQMQAQQLSAQQTTEPARFEQQSMQR